jgi:hypothetical protein
MTWDDEGYKDRGAGLSPIDYWRLCDELTISQAALLLIGEDPGRDAAHVESWQIEQRPQGYEAVKAALQAAVKRRAIKGAIKPEPDEGDTGKEVGEIPGNLDAHKTLLDVESLRIWLRSRGVTSGFFQGQQSDGPEFLNPKHPRYAPKLAAAVRAWMAIDDPQGKSPKTALAKWLRENARAFGLSDDEGKPNEQGIEDCAKVANWQLGGGAPKTPSG